MAPSKIFARNRALGYVSNHVPLVTRFIKRRNENLIVTCVGRAFHTYGGTHFTLLSVSGAHPGDITCLSADTYHIYTASECNVYAWRRGSELKHKYVGHKSPVHALLPFGPHLLSIDEDSNLRLWDIKTEELVLELNFSNKVFKITTLMHPSTYINKVLLASEQGHLQLWNLKTTKMIYTFDGWSSAVTAVEQAPAIDVVAIGLANGIIKLHNLKLDVTIFDFVQDWGAITSISFRSDSTPIMATGSGQGHVVFWNLEKKKVENQILAHSDSVTGLKFLPNEPLLVSSSPDNSLKKWIFDMTDGGARLLNIREGHAEPPTCIKFYGDDGCNILTAGGDSSLRIYSTVTETFNRSLGRASFHRKSSKRKAKCAVDNLIMPPITQFASEKTREKEWDNIAATHLGLGVVTTWSYNKTRMGEHKLLPIELKKNYNANATSLCLTQCGNFVVIGYNIGQIHRFNIQSGIHRATYGRAKGAHKGPVRGVVVDSLNQFVVSAGRDAKVKFWSFKPEKDTAPRTIITLRESVIWLRSHRETSIIALALEDFSIILIDLENRQMIRHFQGHSGQLTDAAFNPDSRWLVTASMDCTIRTWDIPSGQPVDIFKVPKACVSLSFSPTGEFLATTHVGNLGIYLWSNCTLFAHVSLKALRSDYVAAMMNLPGASTDQEDEPVEINDDDDEEKIFASPEQISSDLITMAAMPNSRWMNLLDIDIIKKRNKPKEPPKAPEAAPFFLPTIPALEMQFDLSDVQKPEENSKLTSTSDMSILTVFGKLLQATIDTDNFTQAIARITALGPSSIDFEIQSLSLDPTCSIDLMFQFMKMIKYMIESNQNFQLSQAYLAVFLKAHGTIIQNDKTLYDYLAILQKLQLKNWNILREKLFYNLSVVEHLKKM